MKLISREDAITAIENAIGCGREMATKFIEEWLSAAPTVDAVPVVRCKDCKYHDVAYCRDRKTESKTDVWCFMHEERNGNNWFCADGERKGGDE